jgi:DNA helicase-2/ATP-dependent DNA helicase PcrA
MSQSPWLDSLNERQLEAVTHRASPLLVLAGPGSGKTRILTHRIAWLIREKGARPEQILAVTFTNRAAEEMRQRLASLLGDEAGRVWIYTFHAAAVRILRRFGAAIDIDPGFAILDEDEQRHVLNRILGQLDLSREIFPTGQILGYLARCKNALIDPTNAANERDEGYARIAAAYQAWLRQRNALDFDDLIRQAVLLLRQNEDIRQHYRRTLIHILVDEYQDIDGAQYELLKLLAPANSSVSIVADDDQAIYGWRGANPRLIDDFIDRYRPHIVKLDTSYRCPPNILYGAQRLITHQRSQERQRFMRSEKEGDAPIYHYIFNDLGQEKRWLTTLVRRLIDERGHKPGDIAILYRTHQLGDPVEQALIEAGFRVRRLHKDSFFDLPEPREIVRFLQVMHSLSEENFSAAVNYPLRQIDELTMIQLRRLAEAQGCDLVELARRPHAFPELSPLTRAHLHHFLQWVDALPAADADATTAVRTLFQLLEQLRSPWRGDDTSQIEDLIAFTDFDAEAQMLASAIDEFRPLFIVHPTTIDGHAAAAILHHALLSYLDADARTLTFAELRPPDLPPAAVVIALGNPAPDLPQTVLRLGSDGPVGLALAAWRLAQTLLVS